uniref:Uncharacterized protein n=1 Tax=Chromera velia CCMP2878 TaxID=1169474 RepID=A0A0G4FQI8_9ALVE|eukprot:Cvel_3595.t1-p1 / transcript=Cvel_3595.t1 / gene=Cvel_3595 / organism=Chromera_velia_CCMP2878 / gene_product=hypothetical protein / transcript_product=hypothetical protein / location=Cvel_scaffold147:60090-63178(-) / protein_length=255 / sequence_SO=supercontig / SO=protein_coding / is_pseudo=false
MRTVSFLAAFGFVLLALVGAKRFQQLQKKVKDLNDSQEEVTLAATQGDVEALKLLFDEHEVKVDALDAVRLVHATLLWVRKDAPPPGGLVDKNRKEVVDFLLKKGADKDIKDFWRDTPLAIAERKGFTEIASLLKGEAQPEAPEEPEEKEEDIDWESNEEWKEWQEAIHEARGLPSKPKGLPKIASVFDPEMTSLPANLSQLAKAWKKRSLLLHPDRQKDEAKKKEATVAQQKLNKAYDILKANYYDEGTGNLLP